MSEIIETPAGEQQQETNVEQTQQAETSPLEEKALSLGWRPREQFLGTDDEFIDAKEFVRRQPLFEKIESQNKYLKTLTRSLNELKAHYTKVNDAAYNRAIADLRVQRKEALSTGDGERFELLDDKIKEAEQQKEQLVQLNVDTTPQEVHPELQAWKSRNSWYDSVGYMRTFADQEGIRLHNQGLAPQDVLRQVEKAVRAEFPDKFKNPNKENAISVENGRQSAGKKGNDSFELSDTERKIMNDFVRTKVMTKEEYIASLKTVKGRE